MDAPTVGHQAWLAMETIDALATEGLELGDSFLSAPERLRVSALIGMRRQARFKAGRLLMRRLLVRIYGGNPLTDWPLSAMDDEAPTFLGEAFAQRPDGAWHMAIAHGYQYVVCAMSNGRLGVDLQAPERDRDVAMLGDVLCSEAELERLQSLGAGRQQNHFLALWALKEAALRREAGRSSADALRKLATREIGVRDLALAQQSAPPGLAADAWTWQAPGLTLALVAQAPCAEPQWAFPPPAFMLHAPSSWTIDVPR